MITKKCLLNIISFKHIPLKKYSIIYLNLITTGENYLLILKLYLNLRLFVSGKGLGGPVDRRNGNANLICVI